MKKINLIVGLCFVASSSFASNFDVSNINTDKISDSLISVKEAVAENKTKLEAELMLKEALLVALENTVEFNEAAKNSVINFNGSDYKPLDNIGTRMVVALPAAYVSYRLLFSGAKLSNKAIKALTPSAEKGKAYRAAWRASKKEIKTIEKALKKTKSQYRDTTRATLTTKLKAAKAAKLDALRIKPGSVYKLGRFARVAGVGAVTLAGITGFIYLLNEQIIFALDELGQAQVDALKSSVEDLDAALNLVD